MPLTTHKACNSKQCQSAILVSLEPEPKGTTLPLTTDPQAHSKACALSASDPQQPPTRTAHERSFKKFLELGIPGRGKQQGPKADHLAWTGAEVWKTWIYTSIPPIRLHGRVFWDDSEQTDKSASPSENESVIEGLLNEQGGRKKRGGMSI
jgi:hypothetical protein